MDIQKNLINFKHLPTHIAFIMDGNGRWAQKYNKTRAQGHEAGSKTLENLTKEMDRIGIQYVTAYAFSTENWNRPKAEVDFLMGLLRKYFKQHIRQAKKDNIKIKVIGDCSGLALDIQEQIKELENITKDKTGLVLQLALNYGARDEMIRSIQKIGKDLLENKIKITEIDELMFEQYLDTATIPDPDLLIRTSGEIRLSNFLLWQMAYTELYFCEEFWPDFSIQNLYDAIYHFQQRKRRFGGL